MKPGPALLLSLLLCAAVAHADEANPPTKKSDKKTEKKAKPAAKSQNAAQKAESSVGKWMNDNKIWTTHPDKSKK